MYSWGHSLLAAAFAMLAFALLTDRNAAWSTWLRAGPLRGLGLISYSVYLWHPVLLLLAFRVFDKRPVIADVTDCMLAVTSVGLTVLLCWRVSWPVEAKVLRFGRRFAY
jgi:peptidoglycan/LPS O-acetylase OafA/YrhL